MTISPRTRSVLLVVTRALCLYSFAGWAYIALVALVHPSTLPLQLTHFASWPREDTFGEICFVVSFVTYIVHSLLEGHGDIRPDDEAGTPPADR